MANVLLGVTGSVAAVRTPLLYEMLTTAGHEVKCVATQAATYFFDPATIAPIDPAFPVRNPAVILLDADEWPAERYERGDLVTHIELRKWADIFVIAPLDAHTLAKITVGLCDNLLTCTARAWDLTRPMVLAPAMNTHMWTHPHTRRHLRQIAVDHGVAHVPGHLDELQFIAIVNERSKTLRIVPPITKELACGDVGIGAMAEVGTILEMVQGIRVLPS